METKDSKLLFRIDKYDIIEDDDTKYVVRPSAVHAAGLSD